MKKLIIALTYCFSLSLLAAQPFGNEWIDYSQTHYKIKVATNGVYRIPYSTLAAVIPNLGSLNTNSLAVYNNGRQVPIYVSNNLSLGVNDYIDFYGERNTAEPDSFLYTSGADQPNPNYNLHTDTAIYFLTIRTNATNKRLTEINNALINLPPKEPYYLNRITNYANNGFNQGKYYNAGADELYKSTYEVGEGYTSNTYVGGISDGSTPQVTNQNWTLATPNVFTGGPSATLNATYLNLSKEGHKVEMSLNGSNIYSKFNNGFKLQRETITISVNQLAATNTIAVSTNDNAVSKKQNRVAGFELIYPATFNFNNSNSFAFSLEADVANKKYIEITNFNDNGNVPMLYDLTNGIALKSTQAPGSSPLRFCLPPSPTKRDLILISGAGNSIQLVNTITTTTFENFAPLNKQGNYIIISNSKLLDDGTGTNWVEEYRKHRDIDNNPISGKFQAVAVDVDKLYDQFAYGVNKSPLAIRNFIQWARANWTIVNQPKHVFLIGKAREYPSMRNNANARNQCLVPTFGSPGSDNLLAATRNSDTMTVTIGRLAANTPQQVKDYLNKIKDYEAEQISYTSAQAIAPKIWQKQVLHFSGGTGASEQSVFRSYIESYGKIVKDTLWGANPTTFTKTVDGPIDEALSQIIRQRIQEGASLLTFFGHSFTGGFDFSIDEPENYTNFGKYPVIISNGCFVGLIHDATPGYSERFVMPADKGGVAFLATTSLSVSSSLHNFSTRLYNQLTKSDYTRPFSQCIKDASAEIENCCANNDFDKMVALEMTLHGDPAIQLNQYIKPDYAIETPSVSFFPGIVTPGVDSFEVRIDVTNLGRAIKDSITVSLRRTIFDANNSPIVYDYKKLVKAPYYKDTVTFKLPTFIGTIGYGQNLFAPYVDADFEIDEMAEGNNGLIAPISIFIQSDDVIPIYPYEFAIVPTQGVTLKASTVNPFAKARNYIFQIDTSELFANPLQAGNLFQVGGVLRWTPTITYQDSTVYYWRVAIDSTVPNWHTTSFIYLANEFPGWNQSHYFQWQKDNFLNISQDNDRLFRFPPSTNSISVTTGWADDVGGNLDADKLGWEYNNFNQHRFRMGGCGFTNGGLTFAVIDPATGLPWSSKNVAAPLDNWGDAFGNYHCSNKYYLQYGYDFGVVGNHPTIDPAHPNSALLSGQPWSKAIKNFIDSIPNNYYVLVYTNNVNAYQNWDTTLRSSLRDLGIDTSIIDAQINGPFIYFTQKNNPSFASQQFSQTGYATPLQATINFVSPWFQGQFTSSAIGPAIEWGSMHWEKASLEQPVTDTDTIDIIGVQNSGIETVLVSTTQQNNFINSINAQTYPFIKLRYRAKDNTWRTPGQLDYWRVLYKKAPEAAINPAAHFVFTDSIGLGNNINLEIGLESVTEVDMDSILTRYTIRDAQFNNYDYFIRYNPLPGLDTMVLKFNSAINGSSFQGLNKITIEANPNNDQIEQFHFNNFAELNFKTIGDNINPLLDVTFDGQHIFNGDIVSAKPNILITLKDENQYLALNDTSLINVYLRYPNDNTPRRLNFDDVMMKFYPADSSTLYKANKAQIELKPTFVLDGKYELMVKDRDRSGNNSSNESRFENNTFYDYKTTFEVITKPMITNVLNYPNPFTTSTKFIFTITGSEVPDYMSIQIMTIKGTVVKEIMKEELGPLRVGRNITEYTWNGRDEYGDLLANGVYFYRVVTRLNDKNMDQMSQSYDKFFKQGFGKMVIVR